MRGSRSHVGFTMVEMVLTISVLAVVAASTFPVINAAGDVYGAATQARDASDSCAFAIDRIVRLVRETPTGEEAGEVGLVEAASIGFELSDGRAIVLDGDTLVYVDADGETSPLCRDVEAFELGFVGDDGVTDTAGSPGETRRVSIRLRAQGFELRSCAFMRVGTVQ